MFGREEALSLGHALVCRPAGLAQFSHARQTVALRERIEWGRVNSLILMKPDPIELQTLFFKGRSSMTRLRDFDTMDQEVRLCKLYFYFTKE